MEPRGDGAVALRGGAADNGRRVQLADLGVVAGARTLFARGRARSWGGSVGLAACLGGVYALGAWVSIWYQSPVGGASAFWPPAGLTVATLLLTPRRTWPLWLAFFGAAEFGVDVAHHQAVPLALGYALANTAEPVVGASLVRRSIHWGDRYRARLSVFTVFAVVAGPLVGATIGAGATALLEARAPGWWGVAWTWWLGDALGVLVVGSAILAWSRWSIYEDRPPLAAIAAMSALAGGAIVATAVAWHDPVILAALPALAWAAFAGGFRAVTAVGAAVAGATDWAALTGRTSRLLASASPPHQLAVLQVFLALTLLTMLVLAAEVVERRRGQDLARRAEVARARSEEAAVKLAEAERHSITQDTHDIVGHGLSVMLLQLGAVRRVLDSDPGTARELVASAESIGRKACDDLDVSLGLVGPEQARATGQGLEQLPELVNTLRDAGLRVDLRTEGERGEISTLVDWSAYRIVREALTNVLKHAPAASATVTIRYDEHALSLSVVDDGSGRDPDGSCMDGRGIIGMRERAAVLGGTLDVGPNPGRGFTVAATLPLTRP
jgi:signal transduction histidine kinase